MKMSGYIDALLRSIHLLQMKILHFSMTKASGCRRMVSRTMGLLVTHKRRTRTKIL